MTEDTKKSSGEGGLMSSAWSLGAAAWNYASQTVSKCVFTCDIYYVDDFIYVAAHIRSIGSMTEVDELSPLVRAVTTSLTDTLMPHMLL